MDLKKDYFEVYVKLINENDYCIFIIIDLAANFEKVIEIFHC